MNNLKQGIMVIFHGFSVLMGHSWLFHDILMACICSSDNTFKSSFSRLLQELPYALLSCLLKMNRYIFRERNITFSLVIPFPVLEEKFFSVRVDSVLKRLRPAVK